MHSPVTVLPPRNTLSSSLVTVARSSTSSLPFPGCQPHNNPSNFDSASPMNGTSLSVPSTHHSHHPLPLHSFIPDLKPSFSANPSHHSFFSFSGLTPWIPGLFIDTSEHIRFLLISFSVFLLFTCWFHAVDRSKLTHVSCNHIAH